MAIKVLLVILLLLIMVEFGFIVWLLRNFTEFRDITTHNANVFSNAIAQHSTRIADLGRDVKDGNEDLYGEQSEVNKKLKTLETTVHDMSTKVDGLYMTLNVISRSK